MNAVPTPAARDDDSWPPLVDVSAAPIVALDESDDSVLGRCLRRLLSGLDDRNGVISAFDSFVSDT